MKHLKIYLLAAMAAIAWIGCNDDDDTAPGQLMINLAASYDGLPLVMNQVVDYNGAAMRINVSEFYMSEIELSDGSNQVPVSTIEYAKFTGASGEATTSLVFDEIPAGTYTELRFYVGVPADLNAMKPEDFSLEHPLSNSATYWQNWQSYIFSKLEGKLDTAGLGSTDLTFIYHSGKDDLYTEVRIPLTTPLEIKSGVFNDLNLIVEHKALFKQGNGYLDIAAKPTAHNANDLAYPIIILGNFESGISLE